MFRGRSDCVVDVLRAVAIALLQFPRADSGTATRIPQSANVVSRGTVGSVSSDATRAMMTIKIIINATPTSMSRPAPRSHQPPHAALRCNDAAGCGGAGGSAHDHCNVQLLHQRACLGSAGDGRTGLPAAATCGKVLLGRRQFWSAVAPSVAAGNDEHGGGPTWCLCWPLVWSFWSASRFRV